ncbi:TonB-dependent siderophore receptor [uncultured Novosphingobium sp.]|uniref:TonB-dependent siderophore receptor n=1 Tax=uncultured Novosphingobium sp. TaxID=292277 RepID=UPI002584C6D8|nr:TonB-dependent siderophore receptor [uncultured Novosphingobium sp.]
MHRLRLTALCGTALTVLGVAFPAQAEEEQPADAIIVTGARAASGAMTKTDTPALQTPQPVTIVTDELFTQQGALSVSDTLRYVSGVQTNPYGRDSRIDGVKVRGVNAQQFRDGMRDVFSYYATIPADPYNFSAVQLVRGPASVLFGQGSIGGLFNLVSKAPQFETGGEVSVRYGSFDRKEVLADLTGPLSDTLAARIAARVRDADTQTDFVKDDRVMIAPSLTWRPSAQTDVTLLGLYQEDDGGSTAQFLPLVGTILPNPNGKLRNDLFIGKPGWDRYDGRLLQGTGMISHRFNDAVKISLKARYIDSDVDYRTHYPNSYANPLNPYVLPGQVDANGVAVPDPAMRIIGNYRQTSRARMEIFSTDNNLHWNFNTGSQIEHVLLAGVDFSRSRVRKVDTFGEEYIDIYNIDYNALQDFGGGVGPNPYLSDDTVQKQLGFYLQDQIRFADRVSVVLGARRDKVTTDSFGVRALNESATTFRAGIIADVAKGVSPFFSFTQSFDPIIGTTVDRTVFKPQRGRQFEAGVKLHPTDWAILTVTGYHITQTNTPVDVVIPAPTANDPNAFTRGQRQVGESTSKGIEVEGNATFPGGLQIVANFSYNDAAVSKSTYAYEIGKQMENVPKYNASLWASRPFDLSDELRLLLGGGVRYSGANKSYSESAFPNGLRTPSYTLVDALAELRWREHWTFSVNATNLLDKRFYSACLARGDCFMGEERQVFGTVSYRF